MPYFSLSRRDLLRTVPALVTAAVAPKAFAQVRQDPCSFIAIGDWGSGRLFKQHRVARHMGVLAEQLSSKFVATTGDNFYFFGVSSVDDEHWVRMFENVYTQPSLDIPWYPSLGNHDYKGNPDAQIEYSDTTAGIRNKWRMPARYYAVAGENLPESPPVDLFFLDTQALVDKFRPECPPEIAANLVFENPADQLAWLERQLRRSCERSNIRWRFVLGHHPIYSVGSHGDTPELCCLKRLLKQYRVNAYVCGHDHNLQHFRDDGVDYVVSGGGGMEVNQVIYDCSRPWFAQPVNGFATFSIEGDMCRMAFIDEDGRKVYEVQIGGPVLHHADPCRATPWARPRDIERRRVCVGSIT